MSKATFKLKTHKASQKRFKLTKNGKILRGRAGRRHLMCGKSRKGLRQLRTTATVHPSQVKKITILLGG